MLGQMICELFKRAEEGEAAREVTEIPGSILPGEPVYSLPPDEMQPELSIRADMLSESRDWGHVPLGLETLYNNGFRGAGVLVAICDTGVDYSHPDLKDRVDVSLCKDFTGSSSNYSDRQGHGTHCSGIVAASADGAGMIGAAPEARLMMCKVLGDSGSGASSWIANGIRYAADSGADIISLSLGGPSADPYTRPAIQYAVGKGCWVVCAAGNDGGPADSFPGDYPESCAVGAIDQAGKLASFSTLNRENDVAAPGVNIMSTLPSGRYGSMSGTSMATPYVAGCLAVVRGALKRTGQKIPSQSEILAALRKTSKDVPPAGPDTGSGYGLIQPAELLKLLLTPTNPPPTTPPPGPALWTITKKLTLEFSGDGDKPDTITITAKGVPLALDSITSDK